MIGTLQIKVCGMLFPENRSELETLPIDLFGFILYPPSPRFIGTLEGHTLLSLTRTTKKRVGVFVNENINEILRLSQQLGLTHIQLHGSESPDACAEMKESGLQVIKAFRIGPGFDFSSVEPFMGATDLFLFDTKAEKPGGTGKKFNWDILERYRFDTPFFLSGGIGPDDAEAIHKLRHPGLNGLDLNSGFEDAPGMKNYSNLKRFFEELEKEINH